MAIRWFSSLGRSLTVHSLLALLLAVALGLGGRAIAPALTQATADFLNPIGRLWLSALQLTVLPLVALMAIRAMTIAGDHRPGILGLKSVGLFLLFLAGGALLMNVVGRPMLSMYHPGEGAAAALNAGGAQLEHVKDASLSFSEWVASLLPQNLVRAAAEGQVLPVLIFSIALGIALRGLPPERSDTAIRTVHALADAIFQIVQWLIVVSPAAVFILAFGMIQRAGDALTEVLGVFLLFACGMMALGILLLYPITALAGRVSIREFARAAAPAQLVAVSTRSSLASLPAMMKSGEALRLNEEAVAFVLPLTVSVFKLNRTFSSLAKVFLVAHVLGMNLSTGTIVTFTLTVILMSFTAVGIPSSGIPNLLAYLAAGIPLEAIIVFEAVDWLSDIFMTLLNVTADLSVATILGRGRAGAPAVAVLEPAT